MLAGEGEGLLTLSWEVTRSKIGALHVLCPGHQTGPELDTLTAGQAFPY